MIYLFFILLGTILLFTACYHSLGKKAENTTPASKYFLFLLLGGGLILRVLFALSNRGFVNDTACFASWAERMYTVGPSGFYSDNFFTDYPPGFLYLLYPIGALSSLLQLPAYSPLHLLLLKLPAILCDMICSYLVYREASHRFSNRQALWIMAVYLFHPAVILNSSLWGQVDSVLTLIIVLLCLCLVKGKLYAAYIAFGIGILIKPQTLVFTPVLMAGMTDRIFLHEFSFQKLKCHAAFIIHVLFGMLLLCFPFGLDKVLQQYRATLASYPYVSVNAYNFWAFLGKSWVKQSEQFGFLSYAQWGFLVILLIVLFAFVISLFRQKDNTKYPLLGVFCILTMFTFSVRMHERYLYPGMILLLFCFLYHPCKEFFLLFSGISLLHFCNTAHVLFYYDPQNYSAKAPAILTISAGMLLCVLYFYKTIVNYCRGKLKQDCTDIESNGAKPFLIKARFPKAPAASLKAVSFTRADAFLLASIILLYSGFALYDLGDRTAPTTVYDLSAGESITLDFGAGCAPATIAYYIAPGHNCTFTLELRDNETDQWTVCGELTLQNVFTWQDISLSESARYLRLTLQSNQASLLDLTFLDDTGKLLLPMNADRYPALFDENTLHPTEYTFRNSMYFDEIYHGRTAYEYLNGMYSYENTHPPLGKILISLGITLFGMNPFGWRSIGTLFGICMLPFLYLFGKKISGNTPVATLCCFLFAFDFMHFTQTRIATIDVYITFFVIVMYYFMFCYCRMSFYDTPLKRTLLPLGICGVAMGLGIACKWTGAYAGIGLAILFFSTLLQRYREYCYAKEQPNSHTNGISHADILQKFLPNTKRTIGFCMLFFVTVPIGIYLLSYLPFVDGSGNGLLKRMLQNQSNMFNYHNTLNATHYFASRWYEWPVMVRPVWYYSHIAKETADIHLREGISAFGNPLVWWAGIPAFFYMVTLVIRYVTGKAKAEKAATGKTDYSFPFVPAFLVIGYMAQYLPWFFVTRITFIYHYFPCVAFLVLMIGYSVLQFQKKLSHRAFVTFIILYAAAAFGLFLLFYPVLSGQPISLDFVEKWLRWGKDWIFVSG